MVLFSGCACLSFLACLAYIPTQDKTKHENGKHQTRGGKTPQKWEPPQREGKTPHPEQKKNTQTPIEGKTLTREQKTSYPFRMPLGRQRGNSIVTGCNSLKANRTPTASCLGKSVHCITALARFRRACENIAPSEKPSCRIMEYTAEALEAV